ncbi:hypothetical protein NDU88_004703 [Pleurodeles waltl]|uniref:Uncharacterized protein n=1 Tax=Pleurodeles waltl TaxID=8319 RepID=A0AAV7LKT8_PLEWA|nr:hypothetical protein NDU88_004703 [Pleurodeles waltl]
MRLRVLGDASGNGVGFTLACSASLRVPEDAQGSSCCGWRYAGASVSVSKETLVKAASVFPSACSVTRETLVRCVSTLRRGLRLRLQGDARGRGVSFPVSVLRCQGNAHKTRKRAPLWQICGSTLAHQRFL